MTTFASTKVQNKNLAELRYKNVEESLSFSDNDLPDLIMKNKEVG
jgi:hypothetical protein